MKQFVQEWLLPPKVFDQIVEIWTTLSAKKQGNNISIQHNLRYKNCAIKDKCFILGNGPSIKEMDLKALKNEDLFVMSNFYLHQDYEHINPKYHVVVKIYDHMIPYNDQCNWMKEMEQKVRCDAIFFNAAQAALIKNENLFHNFNLSFLATANKAKRDFDIAKITKHHRTGPIKCLELAIYMGYKKIYLNGIEMDTFCNKEYNYFFDRKTMKTKDKNIQQGDSVKATMVELLYNNWCTYKDFLEIAEYAEKNGIQIYNLSQNSKLDMFEKIDFESALND